MNIISLQKAGYPVRANDLALEEWFDLAEMRAVLEPPPVCPMVQKKK